MINRESQSLEAERAASGTARWMIMGTWVMELVIVMAMGYAAETGDASAK